MDKEYAGQVPKYTPGAWNTENAMMKKNTKVKITFPEATRDVKLLEMAEISAPGGLTIEFRLPFPLARATLTKLADSLKLTGGTVEIQE